MGLPLLDFVHVSAIPGRIECVSMDIAHYALPRFLCPKQARKDPLSTMTCQIIPNTTHARNAQPLCCTLPLPLPRTQRPTQHIKSRAGEASRACVSRDLLWNEMRRLGRARQSRAEGNERVRAWWLVGEEVEERRGWGPKGCKY